MLLGVTICWVLLWLMLPWKGRVIVLAAPVLAMVFDYAENVFIHRMLIVGPDGLTAELVSQASLASQLKAAFSTVSFSLLLVVMVLWIYRRFWHSPKARSTSPN